jgi:hypothetical protein
MATQAELDAAVATLQPLDSDLTAFAGLAIAADKLPYGSGSHTLALADFTAAARALVDDADAAAMLTTLGFSTFVKTLVDDADAATARATLGVIASLFQSGGAQAIKLDDLATPDDNTDLNASTSRHGLLPKLDGSSAKFLDGSGAFSTPAGGSGLLAVTAYAPGTDTSIGSVASATIGDFDATNLAVTFTAPASGNVVVVLSGLAGPNSGTAQLFYGIRESTTVLAKVLVDGSSSTSGRYYTIPIYLTGLSAGSHTYKFGGAAASGTILIYGGPNWGKVTMQVYAAP